MPRSIHGPFARILFTFAGIIAGIGVLTAGLVYLRLHDSLTEQALLRARVIAVNISDGAAPFLFKKAATPMRELLRKQSGKPEMAYILVEDRSRRIFAHSLSVLPGEVASSAAQGAADAARHRLLRVGDSDVYEVAAPILEGRAGTVRVGIWRDKVEEEIRAIIFPVMTWLISLTIGGLGIAAFLAWRIYRPILKLASTAKAISSGALDTPTPHVQDSGELGELSRAIERMRSSVKAAMIRLSR